MYKKTKLLFDRRGFGSIEILAGFLALLLIVGVIISFFMQLQKSTELDHFAEEMAVCAGRVGRCSGSEIDKRYQQLAASTKLKPEMAITADTYRDSAAKTVQYGDAITVKLTLQSSLVGAGSVLPITLSAQKTTQSMQYWK